MVKRDRIVEEFKHLVSIDSPSFQEKEMGRYLKGVLEELGFTVEEDEAGKELGGNCNNIYGTLKGTNDKSPLLFCVHMDTVEPSCGKEAVIGEDGRITSKGDTVLGADDLSGVTAIIEALHVIKEEGLPHRTIEILFTVAEEVHCLGSGCVDISKIESKEGYILDLSGPVGVGAYRAPSITTFDIEVTGKASHAGFAPEEGVHSIAVAALGIQKTKQGRVDLETTVNVGMIQGGLASNIVPPSCHVSGEIRSYTKEGANAAKEQIQTAFEEACKHYGATMNMSLKKMVEAYETPKDHSVVKRFETVCQAKGLTPSLIQTFGGSDLNHLSLKGITGLVISCAMNDCHSSLEYTTVDELEKIASITLSLMLSED